MEIAAQLAMAPWRRVVHTALYAAWDAQRARLHGRRPCGLQAGFVGRWEHAQRHELNAEPAIHAPIFYRTAAALSEASPPPTSHTAAAREEAARHQARRDGHRHQREARRQERVRCVGQG